MNRVAITGGFGFLGWHTACRLRALHDVDVVRLGRAEMADAAALAERLADCDSVIHIAGVNRAETDQQVEQGNVQIARTLANAVEQMGRPVDVVYANSIQAQLDNPYGRGKAAAGTILDEAVTGAAGRFADLLLPNLFGEHGRPGYNSFVATFVHEIVAGRTPNVTGDREIDLLHAQTAADALIDAVGSQDRRAVPGAPVLISEVLADLVEFHDMYAERGEIPDVAETFRRDLFNTYRAAAFPDMWPLRPQLHADQRGDLFEAVRSHGGTGMSYASSTRPGQTRGEHYHLHKIERFVVVQGRAEIQLRRLLHDEVLTFRTNGAQPEIIDMPTMWVHNIRNVGESDLITMFWSDQLLDPDNPDQFPETVTTEAHR